MKDNRMVKIITTGEFYEFVGELFGRTYYRDGGEVKSIHNQEIMVYTQNEYREERCGKAGEEK